MKTSDEIFGALRRIAPNVRFSTTKELDPFFVWDGDGPDPVHEGLFPFDIIFACSVINDGYLKEAKSYLGGSYYEPDEPVGDAHGYLLVKLEEAARELMDELEDKTILWTQVNAAVLFLKNELEYSLR